MFSKLKILGVPTQNRILTADTSRLIVNYDKDEIDRFSHGFLKGNLDNIIDIEQSYANYLHHQNIHTIFRVVPIKFI